jgi:uncharacterized protein (TIGR03437 family)
MPLSFILIGALHTQSFGISTRRRPPLFDIPGPNEPPRQTVADDGTVVFANGSNGLKLLNGGESTWYPFPAALSAVISARGGIVVSHLQWPGGTDDRLYALNTASGAFTLLFKDGFGPDNIHTYADLFQPAISDDGGRVLFLMRDSASTPRQWLFVIGSDGNYPTQFGYAPEGYLEAALSGDGRIAFATTTYNRLVRFDLETGEMIELHPPSPWIGSITGGAVAGSQNIITGGGFATDSFAASTFPAPVALGGVQVQYGRSKSPIIEVKPDRLVVQIPWEASSSDLSRCNLFSFTNISITTAQQGPFEDVHRMFCVPLEQTGLGAIHASGRPVDADNPPQASEIITLFLTGLGPVFPPVPTGVPASADPLSALAGPIPCSLRTYGEDQLVTTFAGLAPGQIGVYKVDVQMPFFLMNPLFLMNPPQMSVTCIGGSVRVTQNLTATHVNEYDIDKDA